MFRIWHFPVALKFSSDTYVPILKKNANSNVDGFKLFHSLFIENTSLKIHKWTDYIHCTLTAIWGFWLGILVKTVSGIFSKLMEDTSSNAKRCPKLFLYLLLLQRFTQIPTSVIPEIALIAQCLKWINMK